MKPPCIKDGIKCEKRYPGCQDRCKDMLEYKQHNEEMHRIRALEVEKVRNHVASCERMRRKRK